jgi:hypothetical protein
MTNGTYTKDHNAGMRAYLAGEPFDDTGHDFQWRNGWLAAEQRTLEALLDDKAHASLKAALTGELPPPRRFEKGLKKI